MTARESPTISGRMMAAPLERGQHYDRQDEASRPSPKPLKLRPTPHGGSVMTNPPQPWFSKLELACESTAVGWARIHTRDVLKHWGVPEAVIDDAVLVVSELATNAVKHSRKPQDPPPWAGQSTIRRFVLSLWCYPDHVQVYVKDEDRTPPVLRDATNLDSNGRGLHLVESLSSKWGYTFPTPDPSSGKVVWAQIEFPGSPPPTDLPEHERPHLPVPRQNEMPQSHDGRATRMQNISAIRDGVMRHGHAAARQS